MQSSRVPVSLCTHVQMFTTLIMVTCANIHRVHSLECTHDSTSTSPVEQQCDQSSTETNLSFPETFPGRQVQLIFNFL